MLEAGGNWSHPGTSCAAEDDATECVLLGELPSACFGWWRLEVGPGWVNQSTGQLVVAQAQVVAASAASLRP